MYAQSMMILQEVEQGWEPLLTEIPSSIQIHVVEVIICEDA